MAPYRGITSKKQAQTAFEDFGGDMFIKARHGAYDGRGNMHVASKTDLDEALKKFAGRKVYAEKRVPFKKELAVMVAKSLGGETAIYPVVETVHERSICLEVLAPAEITKAEYRLARQIASEVANQLDGAGVFGIEMFLTDDGGILVNEIAPRVHNSGHYTIEACYTSQFEQHVRAITGLPLGDASMSVPAAVMINILGERNGPVELSGLHEALKVPKMAAHVYGKSPTKIDRKMGHLTATAQTVSEARARARTARKIISI